MLRHISLGTTNLLRSGRFCEWAIRGWLVTTLLVLTTACAPRGSSSPESAATAAALPDIDSLWDYFDPAGTEAKFLTLLPRTEGHPAYRAELLTQIARTHSLRSDFEQANARLVQAEALLPEGDSRARIRWLLERGRTLSSGGDKAGARPLFVDAWEMGRRIGDDQLAVDAAHMVAIAAASPADALDWNRKALALAEASTAPKAAQWKGSLYNNLGWAYHDAGDFQKALHLFEKALAFRQEQGQAEEAFIARWTVARCLRSLKRYREALAIQQALLADIERGAAETDGYVYEELAECLAALNQPGASRYAQRAYDLLSADQGFAAREPERLKRLRQLAQ